MSAIVLEDFNRFAIYQDSIINEDSSLTLILNWINDYYFSNYNIYVYSYFNLPFGISFWDCALSPDSVVNILNNNVNYSYYFKNLTTSYFSNIEDDTSSQQITTLTKLFEDSVANSQILSLEEKNCLFCIFAIGKYSAFFWENYFKENGYFENIIIKSEKLNKILKKRQYEKWVANLTISDATGAYIGFLCGIAGGPLSMGVGAAAGGVGSSAVAAFTKWLGL